jgi:hypothetical protein
MGFEPQQPRSHLESVNEFMDHMALGIEEATAALTKVKDEYTMYYNCQCEPAPVFTPGDKVWLDGSDIATNRPSSKLSHRRLGSFVVEACVGLGAYRLALPPHLRHLHPVDTPQAPYPRVDQSWPKLSNVYRSSYAECRCNNSSHTQSQQQFTLHSYASNRNNTRRSQSVPSIIVYTLISYDTTYL